MTPGIVFSNTYKRCFQYKVLNKGFFLVKNFSRQKKKSNLSLCSFCKEENETAVIHL